MSFNDLLFGIGGLIYGVIVARIFIVARTAARNYGSDTPLMDALIIASLWPLSMISIGLTVMLLGDPGIYNANSMPRVISAKKTS